MKTRSSLDKKTNGVNIPSAVANGFNKRFDTFYRSRGEPLKVFCTVRGRTRASTRPRVLDEDAVSGRTKTPTQAFLYTDEAKIILGSTVGRRRTLKIVADGNFHRSNSWCPSTCNRRRPNSSRRRIFRSAIVVVRDPQCPIIFT